MPTWITWIAVLNYLSVSGIALHCIALSTCFLGLVVIGPGAWEVGQSYMFSGSHISDEYGSFVEELPQFSNAMSELARPSMEHPVQWPVSMQARELNQGGYQMSPMGAGFNEPAGVASRGTGSGDLRRGGSGAQMVVQMEDPGNPSLQRLQEHRRLAQSMPRWVHACMHACMSGLFGGKRVGGVWNERFWPD